MAGSRDSLETINVRRSLSELANEQRRRFNRFFSMNHANNGAHLSLNPSRSFHSYSDHSSLEEDTESELERITNLRWSDFFDLPGEYVPMNPEIFSAVRAGSQESMETIRRYGTPVACLKSFQGDSVLHLAAAWGHLELVKCIISESPCLLFEPNSKDQLPIHVAACAGHSAVVEILAFVSARISEEEKERLNVHIVKDINGDNPLHSAIKRQNMEVTSCLVNADQRASFLANKDGISPLYLAVEAGNVSLVKAMLNNFQQGQASPLEGRKSLVHAALKSKNTEVLDVILNESPSLVNERDEEGRTCLSVGASLGYYEGICKLLDRASSNVYESDEDGSFSIHMAVEKGHVKVVKEILNRCPNSKHLLNKQGQNILHVAAKNGKVGSFLESFIKGLDGNEKQLLEEQDVNGNTPIHLATIHWRPRTLSNLTRYASRKVLMIQNKDGLTAKDIAELNLQSRYVLRERMTLMVLLCACSPRGFERIPTSGMTLRSRSEHDQGGDENYKDRVDALLLVATLVATVAFAAGIAVPGGFNSSSPNSGLAILSNDFAFSCFMLLDTVAMQTSVIAIVALVWAQLGDPTLVHSVFHLALPLLFVSLVTMSLAFSMAVLATNKHNHFLLSIMILVSAIFGYVLLSLVTPYVIPLFSGSNFLRGFTEGYLDSILMIVNEDDSENNTPLRSSQS